MNPSAACGFGNLRLKSDFLQSSIMFLLQTLANPQVSTAPPLLNGIIPSSQTVTMKAFPSTASVAAGATGQVAVALLEQQQLPQQQLSRISHHCKASGTGHVQFLHILYPIYFTKRCCHFVANKLAHVCQSGIFLDCYQICLQ